MNVLFISGWQMGINDGSKYWDIADRLLSIPGVTVYRQTWESLLPSQLIDMDCVVAYSYGMSALWHSLITFPNNQWPILSKLFILAGVPRWLWGYSQASAWSLSTVIFKSATCYNVSGEPESCPINNPIPGVFENVDCDSLCSGFRHVTIQGVQLISDTIFDYVKNFPQPKVIG